MSRIVSMCLFIMSGITLLAVVMGESLIGVTVQSGATEAGDAFQGFFDFMGWAPQPQGTFFIDEVQGAIIFLTTITVIAGLVGIQILGSGLSESGHRTIVLCTVYGGAWVVLSTLAYPLVVEIELFGQIIYWGLTIAYVVGIIQNLALGG